MKKFSGQFFPVQNQPTTTVVNSKCAFWRIAQCVLKRLLRNRSHQLSKGKLSAEIPQEGEIHRPA